MTVEPQLDGAESGAWHKRSRSSPGMSWLTWARHVNLCRHMRLGGPTKHRTTRPLFSGLVLGAALLPAMLYAVVAWQDRISVLNQAGQNVRSTVRTFEEHARNVFETHKLVASLINDHIRGMSWREIADSDALHAYLADVVRDYPQIKSLWLIDPAGLIRNSSAVFPAPSVSVTDRDYFTALREHDTGLFIGQLVHGRVFTEDIFNVAQRRSSASGSFDGVVVVSALPSYFTNFWNAATRQPGVAAALVRREGAILARAPPADADTPPLAATSPLMRAIDTNDSGFYRGVSTIDGRDRIYAFQKISGFPVYVGHGISESGALRTWHDHLLVYGGFFAMGTLGLVLLALVAALRAGREAVALHHWRETAQQLNEEAERRAVVEGQLRQAQKMEALGQIASGIAHDFGNILYVIAGYLELLQRRAAPGDLELVTKALGAASRGRDAIRSILSFARRQPLSPEVFDLNAALSSMDSMLRQALGSRVGLEIVPTGAPCWITADRNQTELAILNVALNARDAMPSRGTLTVATKAMRLAGEPDGLAGDFAAVTVKDTGTGMPPEVLAKVFDPFFTTKVPGKGTGLGLSMVYGFTKQSHGAVTIESSAGRGTTVVLYLPLSASSGAIAR